jgi:hypothetical protein
MTPNKRKVGFSIAVGCPGCGGALELEEDFFVLTCRYCESVLRVKMPRTPAAYLVKGRIPASEIRFQVDRFLKTRQLPLTSSGLTVKSLYYPYWKIDGMLVKVRNRRQQRELRPPTDYDDGEYFEQEVTDINVSRHSLTVASGCSLEGIPISIGMRADYIKLHPFSEQEVQDDYDTLALTRPNDQNLHKLVLKFASVGEIGVDSFGINKTELFEPSFSVIYFPFHIIEQYDSHGYSRYLMDGVTGRILHHRHPSENLAVDTSIDQSALSKLEAAVFSPEKSDTNSVAGNAVSIDFGHLDVLFHRCPVCGEDLPPRQSHAYICRNCHELVFLEEPQVAVDGMFHTQYDRQQSKSLFPFWSFEISGEDRERVRRLFGGIFDSSRLLIPAFSMPSIEAMFRLVKRMSAAAPKLALEETEDIDDCFRSVDIGPNRALTIARVLAYRELLARNQKAMPGDARVAPLTASLVYVSFQPQSYFFVDSILGAVTFEKSHIAV